MAKYPEAIQNLIDQFNKLPGIGEKTSQRFVFYLLKQPKEELEKLAKNIEKLKDKIFLCQNCFNIDEKSPCSICSDKKRDQKTICVVCQATDIRTIEKTQEYNGLYHVLEGTINQVEGIGPEKLRIKELISRIKKDGIREIILALNSDIEGETTILYLKKLLNPSKIKITRLAR
jgi:recombination protein RecR